LALPTFRGCEFIYSPSFRSMKRKLQSSVLIGLSVPFFYLLWIVFVGTFSLHELLVGIIATFLATLGLLVVIVQYPPRFSPGISDLLACWRLPWYLLSGTWEVLYVAARDSIGGKRAQSLFRVSPFEADGHNPRTTARCALAVVFTTVAPNFIVLGVNASDQKMLFHQIERSSVPKMTEQLGAEA
jgi:multisubunit Na+/H+ antiporter MnhE subunit